MNDFLELAEARFSVRKFRDEPIKKEHMEKILRAGYVAPTACNRQPQRVLVIESAEGIARLRKCTACHFFAPAAVLVCYSAQECWRREFDGKPSGDIDASIVATHMMLEAASLGVGVTWVMYFIPDAVREEFAIPEGTEPVALLVMGYPAPDAKPFPGHGQFRPESEIVRYDSF